MSGFRTALLYERTRALKIVWRAVLFGEYRASDRYPHKMIRRKRWVFCFFSTALPPLDDSLITLKILNISGILLLFEREIFIRILPASMRANGKNGFNPAVPVLFKIT
jgi:hypothetical protein